MKKQLILVDGSSYLFRAYHALPNLTGPDKQPTGAIFGVINMLRSLDKSYSPDYFAVVFDTSGKTFRHDIYPDYKANRPPTPPDLKQQFNMVLEMITASGYPILQYDNVEADDTIGTLARRAEEQGMKVLISTGDKDLAQLVNDNVHLLDTMKKGQGESLTDSADAVKKKFGVTPQQIPDYLALAGDASDGIAGVPGVGPKTAVKWLEQYKTLDGVIDNADAIQTKAGESLRETIPMLKTYLQLTTIDCTLALKHSPTDLVRTQADDEKLHDLYRQCGFRSWLKGSSEETTRAELKIDETDSDNSYRLILSERTLQKYVEKLRGAECFSLDVAIDGEVSVDTRIIGIALAPSHDDAVYIPLHHDYAGAPHQLSFVECMDHLASLLEDEVPRKCGSDIKRITHAFANHGITLRGAQDDSMLLSYVFNSVASDHDIAKTAQKYLGIETTALEMVVGKGVKRKSMKALAVKTVGDYVAQRADTSLQLQKFFCPRIEENGLTKVYRQIEMPLIPVLTEIERKGVMIDSGVLLKQSEELKQNMQSIEAEIYQIAGVEFNIGSPKQLQKILYDEAKLPVLKKTPKGQPSTNEEVLQQLAAEHELPRLILEHRTLSKLKSTYTDTLPQMVNPNTGRIHTSYHQAVTATGRLSSSNPNLQNIPIRSEEGRRIRQAFIAPDGFRLVAIDYSQIEMRIMAHLSGDENLLERFARGDDIHTATAAEVFGCDISQVGANERRIAKAINFGLIYGMSAYGLARQLGISNSEAAAYVEKYFDRYCAVKDYMDDARARAHQDGYVETIFGRRLYVPDIQSKNASLRRYAERTAINAPMQGSAADIIKLAMIDIHQSIPEGTAMIMQVHDELVFEVPQQQVSEMVEWCSDKMNSAATLDVPLTVDAGDGENWDIAH